MAVQVSHSADNSGTAPGASLLDELMTAHEVAEVLRMRVSTIEGYARRGLLPSVKVGRHRRFIRSEIERAVALLRARRGDGA
jgi:excisionase family DNA binding protein